MAGDLTITMNDLADLQKEFKDHREQQDERFDCMIAAQERNTKAVEALVESTQGVVSLYNDVQGAARVGLALQSFIVWVSKWTLLGTVAAAGAVWLSEHFGLK